MTNRTRDPGEFCWVNMVTPRTAEAREFFARVLGWTYRELPGMGHTIQVDGHDIGGVFDVVSPRTPHGMPPLIGVMLKVADADAIAARVTALGGRAETPFDIGEAGRMSVCHDPSGAEFDVWQPKRMNGTDVDPHAHGAPSWFETLTTDVPRASRFYRELFGWASEVSTSAAFEYTTFQLGGTPVAGMMAITPAMGDLVPHWGTYFTVRDTDAAVAEALGLGARVCVSPKDIPGVGRFAGLVSPQGVVFYVIRYAAR